MKLTPWEPDLRTLVERIDRGDIDLQPDFQRQEVWSVSKKRKLIDTVLRNWSIPPVHLVEVDAGRLEVLDGQQRLAAVRDYIHDEFSIDGQITPLDLGVQALHRKFFSRLPPASRRQVENYPLRCFRVTDYQPEEPSELFYRLNQPTMLTPGETRNALYGPAREQLKALVGRFLDQGNNRNSLGFSNGRLAYDDVIARVMYFLQRHSMSVKGTEARISELFRGLDGFSTDNVERVERAIDLFSEARETSTSIRFNKASVTSWLLFFSRSFPADVDRNIMRIFAQASKKGFTAHFASEAAATFEDRASLRVTDVSSVVYRDVVLCYLYSCFAHGPLPERVDCDALVRLEAELRGQDDLEFEGALERVIDVDVWGRSL